jgi:S-DNA-T family DNA segregation ATPase FtsK/SpoIIIE
MNKKEIIREIEGLLVLLFGVFLLVSLASFSAADLPQPLVIGASRGIENWCGRVGAHLSFYLFRHIGIFASYIAAAVCMLWGGALFTRRPVPDGYFKGFAAALLILSVAIVERFLIPQWFFPTRLVGGYYGTFFGGFLRTNLGTIGAYLTVFALLVASFVLSTNLLFFDSVKELLARVKRQMFSEKSKKAQEATPVLAQQVEIALPHKEEVSKAQISRRKSNLQEEEKEEKDQKEKEKTVRQKSYALPPLSLLSQPDASQLPDEAELGETSALVEKTLANFDITAKVVGTQRGPTLTQYELSLAPGVTVNSICSRETDISVALGVQNVRIVAPIPGKNTIGIEVPNRNKANVSLRGFLESPEFTKKKYIIPLFLGRDTSGDLIISDLTKMPHLLVAGATGSGKSVCLNSIIMSILFTRAPEDVKLILIDPKRVEFSSFEEIPHLYHPVVRDMRKAADVLNWATRKMDERYEILSAVSARNIQDFNSLGKSKILERLSGAEDEIKEKIPTALPYVVIVIDELSDLLLVARKEVEMSIVRLAQKSRAVGIHLVVATQRPCVDVISGHIKANMPSRIAFRVTSMVDSRTILDQNGAELLLGSGDMLYQSPDSPVLKRAQGAFVTPVEIERTISFSRERAKPEFDDELATWRAATDSSETEVVPDPDSPQRDEKYYDAVKLVLSEQRGSVSMLQRKLGVGYGRAARYMDFMEEDGIVGSDNSSKPREVLVSLDMWLAKNSAKAQS